MSPKPEEAPNTHVPKPHPPPLGEYPTEQRSGSQEQMVGSISWLPSEVKGQAKVGYRGPE